MKDKIMLIVVIFTTISLSINAQHNYIGGEFGGKISLTTQTRALWGSNITIFSYDNSKSLILGRYTKKNIKYEFWFNHETISVKYKINGPIVYENTELNISRRYGLFNIGLRSSFQIYQKDNFSINNYWGIGYFNMYHIKHYESSSNVKVRGENFRYNNNLHGDTTIPYIVTYNEYLYTNEANDTFTFNISSGISIQLFIKPKIAIYLRGGYTLGLSPIMSRMMTGTISHQIFIDNLNKTLLITKGDNISLSVGVTYTL